VTPPVLWPVARLRQFGGFAWIVAAGLAVGGTFAPLVEGHQRVTITITAWGISSGGSGDPDVYPNFGIPIVVGAVALVAAALLALTSTRLHPASAPVLAARMIGGGASGVVIGCAVTVYLFTTILTGQQDPTQVPVVSTGLGIWLLTGASVVGLVGTILLLVPHIEQRAEPETPPMGIPVVRVLEPEFEEREPEPRG
jgi:hypothetical protein